MRLERFFVALAVVVGFMGAVYLWTRPAAQPGVRIDETVVLEGRPSAPHDSDAGPHAAR
jgi:hypothetical protein